MPVEDAVDNMPVEDSVEEDNEDQPLLDQDGDTPIPADFRLATSKRTLSLSLNAIRLAVFSDSVASTILDPNFAFMAFPGAHKDSFESTSPFGQSAATYFLAMTALLGAAIGSTFMGKISDVRGRKICVMVCLGVGVIGSITNYLARKSFWGFCASNFCQGLFAATVPVAMAYVSDVHSSRQKKDSEIGVLIGLFMIGSAGGGVAAILMEEQGLFAPLFVGAALDAVAFVVVAFLMIEPNQLFLPKNEDDDENDIPAPEQIDKRTLWNIVLGALLDNVGSSGLLPLAMAPLALQHFYVDQLVNEEPVIMSQVAFKWLSVMVALTVIPGAAVSQSVFDKLGAPGGCILGNVITALMIVAVLYIAQIEPATTESFAGFIVALYVGFPFTVLSQLSTGPMLDMIAPVDQRGYVQGLNTSVMSLGTAVTPYILGEAADRLGVSVAMWMSIGISLLAAMVNVPLIFVERLKPQPKRLPKALRGLKWEDSEFISRAMKGEWVPATELERLNMVRMEKGQPFLVIPYRKYSEDKRNLGMMRAQAKWDFLSLRNHYSQIIESGKYSSDEEKEKLLRQIHASTCSDEQLDELRNGLGTWFVDYLEDSGYFVDDNPTLFKQMIMKAFPPVNDGQTLTVNNIEGVAVNYIRVYNKLICDDEEAMPTAATKAFAGSYVAI